MLDRLDEIFSESVGALDYNIYNPDNVWHNMIIYYTSSEIATDLGMEEFDYTDEKQLNKAYDYYSSKRGYVLGFDDGDIWLLT